MYEILQQLRGALASFRTGVLQERLMSTLREHNDR